jgi:hypothetical protein
VGLLTLFISLQVCVPVFAEMRLEDIESYFSLITENGEEVKRCVTSKYMTTDSLEDGWHQENGIWYYIYNGQPESGYLRLNNQYYLLGMDGRWLEDGTEEKAYWDNLLSVMHEAHSSGDESWSLDVSDLSEIEQSYLLNLYVNRYIKVATNISNSGFKVVNNVLTLNKDSLYYEDRVNSYIDSYSDVVNERTDRAKLRYFYDKMIEDFDYDYTYNPKSFLGLNEAIDNNYKITCEAYANIYKNLCDYYGLDCIKVIGTSDGEGHAWNIVTVDGKKYGVDVTFGDTDDCGNNWFMLRMSEFNATHVPD